jgi:UPF0755 protein
MKKLVILCCVLLMALTVTAMSLWQWWHNPFATQRSAVVMVGEGSSLASVADELVRRDVLRRPQLWRGIARLQGLDGQIKRGEYEFTALMSPADLLAMLVAGTVRHYSVTLPEGITLAMALAILQQQPEVKALLDGVSDPRLKGLLEPGQAAEGLFFPDTYSYIRGDSDLDILKRAHRRMQEVLTQSWSMRSTDELPYSGPYEALIMASVVERETGVAEERRRIAGVFVRRLQKRMRLQTDPTVIYGLGPEFDGNLRRRHLEDKSNPYNTYKHRQLPPTPIALPGREAIDAALHPLAGSELYFVARGDGSHQFSDTLEQHLQAVRQYQLQRRKNYRSSPPKPSTEGEP